MALVQAAYSGGVYLARMSILRSGYPNGRPGRRGAGVGDSEARGHADSRSPAANPAGGTAKLGPCPLAASPWRGLFGRGRMAG